jgi:glycosyltransferase involved in cell wall biosynthesis
VILVENLPVPLDRRTWDEARSLQAAGWEVAVIGPRGKGDMRRLRDRIDGIAVFRYPQRAATGLAGYLTEYLPSMIFSLAWYISIRARGRVDVVHACNPPDLFWPIGLVNRALGGSFVFDQHDVGPELAATKFGMTGPRAWLIRRLTLWLEAMSYRTARLVVAPNESYRDIAVGRGRRPAETVILVRNAPNLALYRELSKGISPEAHRVGYVGVMGSQDGVDLLLQAWSLVCAEPDGGDACLELVGDGEARPSLERLAGEKGIADRVRFHGYLRPDRFIPIVGGFSVCVSPVPPSPFNDVSTRVKVSDYLALGRGVVGFDLAETRRLAGSAVSLVVPATPEALAGRLIELMRDPGAAARLGEASARRADEIGLNWEASAATLVRGYDDLRPNP